MTASINPYFDKYQQACKAYVQKDYNQAVALIDEVAENLPDDPNTHLLRGHIYYVLNKYEIAQAEYQSVLDLTEDLEVISCAKEGLDNISKSQSQYTSQNMSEDLSENISERSFTNVSEVSIDLNSSFKENNNSEIENTEEFADSGFNLDTWSELSLSQGEVKNPFEMVMNDLELDSTPNSNSDHNANEIFIDPFSVEPNISKSSNSENKEDNSVSLEIPSFLKDNQDLESNDIFSYGSKDLAEEKSSGEVHNETDDLNNSPFAEFESSFDDNSNEESDILENELIEIENNQSIQFGSHNSEDHTLFTNNTIPKIEEQLAEHVQGSLIDQRSLDDSSDNSNLDNNSLDNISLDNSSPNSNLDDNPPENISLDNSSHNNENLLEDNFESTTDVDAKDEISTLENISLDDSPSKTSSSFSSFDLDEQQSQSFDLGGNNSFDLEAFESAFASQDPSEDSNAITDSDIPQSSNIEFLDDFEEFDDLGNIPGFDTPGDSSFGDSQASSGYLDTGSNFSSSQPLEQKSHKKSSKDPRGTDSEAELFSINSSQEAVPIFTQTDIKHVDPQVNVEQGVLAPLENAPLKKKQWLITGAVGAVSMIVVATVTYLASNFNPPQQRESVRNTGWAMALAAGISSAATTGFMSSFTMRQIRRTTQDLQNQFNAVRQGNLNVQATVYSEDELGQLATGFNEMARVIFTTTYEATRKAQEQEEAKENLQRQVIRLLDDVEGAARGDLTVQAEVTADVLGAVADAFNLTIQNLRDIVQQVKVAAREVTKGATNSETFARALSSDALRQAEELAGTLNSVQVMTDSIHRVAEAAREAEAVARDASDTALKGGEAVENTVAGILEIRETVAETTRKVKRLAESSQEISKIVALISQIASRTNLLALNASIEAARAGDAGRGFAIVADEVRQLADKSAKSLKEIEQIVLQIQSETGSVMTAMEEGTQQVIKGTKLAEEAKRSLENIIHTAKRIDILVRSITADTVNQTDTSRAVAHVMQSVELTAQETSQEAQRVSGALQHLVGVSRDLISSVERFRVETVQSK
ncbi:methyl-accepting chemotaxis protein [Mastigocoleus testarum]|uniref:Chemotaxis protein n=1 Tax=Mastigocoleus testarum BC008 TaxID=371196 RepID=A0A0V7ZY13_9CYAN|nr:methyl-accepting chemotaxis protein [Mastigocoleus testarum]KST69460.1 chemotaxis protein [Mastigocoleus testarum BC008]